MIAFLLFLSTILSGNNIAFYAVVNPCPEMVAVGDSVTIVCDDGAATFDLASMQPGESYHPHVKAGSHTVRAIIHVQADDTNQFRAWVDEPVPTGDGRLTSKVTMLDLDNGEVNILPN